MVVLTILLAFWTCLYPFDPREEDPNPPKKRKTMDITNAGMEKGKKAAEEADNLL